MAVFRVEKTKDFTIMSNHHLRNTELSLKAKGLLSLMLSLPEDWDYTTKGLAHICKDGVDSITTALKELERHGYLTRQRLRYDNGQLGDIEYTIHEQPVSTENTGLSPKRENPRQVKPEQAKPKQAEPEQENPAQLNTNPLKTKKSKKDKSITYPSIYPAEPEAANRTDGMDRIELIEAYREIIKENIEYDLLVLRYGRERLDEALELMISTTEFIGARAFLFHTERREDGHLYGDVLMMDLDTLRQDIKRNILYPCGVNIERKDGSAATVSLKEWTEMDLYEKDALKSWGFSYAPNQVTEWQYHYSTMFRQWMDQAFRYMPQDLEERLNMQYMEAAQNPDMDKYRIPQGTAKQMLLYDEAPVYRLLPSGSEKIAPIAAISTGLWYENYREFAIAPEDLGALDKLIRRETDRLTGNLPQLHKNEERRPAPER